MSWGRGRSGDGGSLVLAVVVVAVASIRGVAERGAVREFLGELKETGAIRQAPNRVGNKKDHLQWMAAVIEEGCVVLALAIKCCIPFVVLRVWLFARMRSLAWYRAT